MVDILTKKTTITRGATNPQNISKDSDEEKADSSQTAVYVIYFFLGVVEIFLAFRFIFKLTGANPISGFVSFVYSLTQIAILPFSGIFPQATTSGAETTAIFDPATLVAIVVYAVLAWGVIQIVDILSKRVQ